MTIILHQCTFFFITHVNIYNIEINELINYSHPLNIEGKNETHP